MNTKLNDRKWQNLVFINEIINNFNNSEKKLKEYLKVVTMLYNTLQ